jgi:hypothetical protein
MAEPLVSDWESAAAAALALPGTELARWYGQPAVRVAANRRPFLNVGHEPDTSFVLALDHATIELLMATEPETYWQSPHYAGHAHVLVRFAAADGERVRAMIALAREQAAARPPARSRK